MKKEYWLVLLAYIFMQISSLSGIPFVTYMGMRLGMSYLEMEKLAVAIWMVISFPVTLNLVVFILKNEFYERNQLRAKLSVLWVISGVFMAIIAQYASINIESLVGIKSNSDNTKRLIELIESFPVVILVISFVAPALEEIVFRKVIFGALYKRFNFFLSAVLSSIIFALVHFEIEHTLIYSALGFTFAYLYVKTNRILVPIVAHAAMNTLVVMFHLI